MSTQFHSSDSQARGHATDSQKQSGVLGVWDVFRDFLSCFRVPRSIYGKPTDDLSAYAQAVALYGVDSQEAKSILDRNADSEYFLARAGVLQRCKAALKSIESDSGSSPVENPISAGEYADLLFRQSQEVALLQPEFEVTPAVESYLLGVLRVARQARPTLHEVRLFVRRDKDRSQELREQCRSLSRVVPRSMTLHVVHCAAENAGDLQHPWVLTDQGGFEFPQNVPTCESRTYRLVAPERHVLQWQRLKDRSRLAVVDEYDIQGEDERSVETPEAVMNL